MRNSKKEERLIILNMLKESKITVDESIKLLNAIDNANADGDHSFDFGNNVNMDDKLEKITSSLDSFAKEVGEKAKTTYKDFEPKLKSGTKTVIEKTMSVLGDINNSLAESLENMKKTEENDKCCDPECECTCDNENKDQ